MDGNTQFVSFPMMASVIRMKDLTLAQAVFLCDVLSLARMGKPYWKSRAEIGAMLRIKERAVYYLISELVELGYIARIADDRGKGIRKHLALTEKFYRVAGIDAPDTCITLQGDCTTVQPNMHHSAVDTCTTVQAGPAPQCSRDIHRELHRDNTKTPARASEGTGNTSCRDDIDEEAFAAQSVPQDILDSAVQLIGGTIAGPVYSQIAECVGTYGEKWVRRALQIARERDGRSIRYVVGILRSWKRNGYDGDARNATARRRAEAEEKRKAEADYYNRIADENLRKAMERWEREEHGQKNDGTAGKHQAKRDDWGGDGGGDAEVPLQAVPRTRLHLYQA